MSNEIETAKNFNALFVRYGDSWRTLDWGSLESQELRFGLLASVANLNGASVLDVGCGLGHFYGWLKANEIKVDYTGFDIADQLVQEAKKTYPDACFLTGSPSDTDFLSDKKFDYVFASGIFSTYTSDSMGWMLSTVCRMWSWSKKGVALNSLSAWAETKESNEFYADPLEVVVACRSLTKWVSLRHDYHPRDFTIFLYHSAQD